MTALPEPPSDSKPPFWDYWRHDLWQRVVNGDDPEGFAGWPCIYHTMRVDHWIGATNKEYERMAIDNHRLIDACLMPDFGTRKDYYLGKYSAALIHQAHHLYQWMKFSGRDLANFTTIFEFGGGYGAMALVARRLGFTGNYYIYDLPEFALLQEYYLSNLGVINVHWKTSSKALKYMPPVNLFIACFSLSEVGFPLRQNALTSISADNYLFLYSGRFADYDNSEYFGKTLVENVHGMQWDTNHADHLPDLNYYTFGKRL